MCMEAEFVIETVSYIKRINTLEYDRLFPYAVAWEQAADRIESGTGPNSYPVSMTDEAKEKYLI